MKDDLCRLDVTVYENKYTGVVFSDHKESPGEDITRLRLDLFSRKASEQSTVPLTSVLKLQYCRSCLVVGLLEKHHGD